MLPNTKNFSFREIYVSVPKWSLKQACPINRLFHLIVAPSFIVTPASQSVHLRSNVLFACSVTGSPSPVIRWSRNGVVLGGSPQHRIFNNGSLLITDVTDRNVGSYECFASNTVGRTGASAQLIISGMFNITIPHPLFIATCSCCLLGPPVLVNDALDITVSEGKIATLRCPVEGSPAPSVLWKKEGKFNHRFFYQNHEELQDFIWNISGGH